MNSRRATPSGLDHVAVRLLATSIGEITFKGSAKSTPLGKKLLADRLPPCYLDV
jgi:hypothetical protein